MKQVLISGSNSTLTGAVAVPKYNSISSWQSYSGIWFNSEANAQQVIPTAGKLRKLKVKILNGESIVNSSITFTIRLNGIDTALTCVMNTGSANAEDSTHEISLVAGDLICIKASQAAGTPDSKYFSISLEFEATNSNTAIWLSGCSATTPTGLGLTYYDGLQSSGYWTGSLGYLYLSIMPLRCTITDFAVKTKAAPGTGRSWTFNVVRDDGATLGSAVTISGSNTYGIRTGDSLQMFRASGVGISCTPAGAGTFGFGTATWGIAYSPQIDGEFFFLAQNIDVGTDGDGPGYFPICCGNTTSSAVATTGQVSQFPTSQIKLGKLIAFNGSSLDPSMYDTLTLTKNDVFTSMTGSFTEFSNFIDFPNDQIVVSPTDKIYFYTETGGNSYEIFPNIGLVGSLYLSPRGGYGNYIDGGYY